jgi:hypothetical protein
MKRYYTLSTVLFLCLSHFSTFCFAEDDTVLEGTWRLISYFNAGDQKRYPSEGYMMFGKAHWLHVVYLNRDERPLDFAEAHHGTYKISGANSIDLFVDLDMHMDPKTEFQAEPVWYGGADDIKGASYKSEAGTMVLEFPSSAQIVMEKIE